MAERFRNKVVVITGATSGIGREAALEFKREGAQVVAAGRDRKRLMDIGTQVAHTVELDVTDQASVDRAFHDIHERFGRIDVLVNNAGIGLFQAWQDTTDEAFRRVMEVNLYGAIRTTYAALPGMLARHDGVIVHVASVAGERGYPKHTAYCTSKHALIGHGRALRKDLRDTGVSVVVVCPPAVRTPFFENAGYMTFDADHVGLKLMSAEEVARGIVQATAAKKEQVVLGGRAKALWLLDKLAPFAVERMQRAKR